MIRRFAISVRRKLQKKIHAPPHPTHTQDETNSIPTRVCASFPANESFRSSLALHLGFSMGIFRLRRAGDFAPPKSVCFCRRTNLHIPSATNEPLLAPTPWVTVCVLLCVCVCVCICLCIYLVFTSPMWSPIQTLNKHKYLDSLKWERYSSTPISLVSYADNFSKLYANFYPYPSPIQTSGIFFFWVDVGRTDN